MGIEEETRIHTNSSWPIGVLRTSVRVFSLSVRTTPLESQSTFVHLKSTCVTQVLYLLFSSRYRRYRSKEKEKFLYIWKITPRGSGGNQITKCIEFFRLKKTPISKIVTFFGLILLVFVFSCISTQVLFGLHSNVHRKVSPLKCDWLKEMLPHSVVHTWTTVDPFESVRTQVPKIILRWCIRSSQDTDLNRWIKGWRDTGFSPV